MVFESFLPIAISLITKFSYPSIALVSFIGSSTIFIPFPVDASISFAAATLGLNPLLIGLFAGIGSALGELVGFFVGAGGRHVVEKKEKKIPKWVAASMAAFKKYGFSVIALAAFLPFPFDVIGILAGVTGYDIKKFFLAALIGKTAKTTLIAYAGVFGIPLIENLIIFLKTVI